MAIKILGKAATPVPTEPSSPQPPVVTPEPPVPQLANALSLSVGSKSADLPPWEIDESQTILDALKDFASGKKTKGKLLKLIHRTNPACQYVVKTYDPDTGRAVLEGGYKGGLLKPVITEREVPLYYPMWL